MLQNKNIKCWISDKYDILSIIYLGKMNYFLVKSIFLLILLCINLYLILNVNIEIYFKNIFINDC